VRGDDTRLGSVSKLLFLRLASTGEDEKREARFADELAILLEGMAVESTRPEDDKFVGLTLGGQIADLRPMMDASGAIAAIWMTEPLPDQLLLHLVVISTGRALLRLMEIEASEGFEADLALSAKELLGTAFLFEAVPNETESLERVVESVRKEAARPLVEQLQTEAAALPEKEPKRDWASRLEACLEGGLVSAEGPSVSLGGLLAVERRITGEFSAYLSLVLAGGPLDSNLDDIQIDTFTIAPGVGALYLWHFGRFALGPGIQAHAQWSNVMIRVEREDTQVFRAWQIRGSLTLETRVKALEFLSIAAAAGMVATPEQDVYQRVDTAEVIMATPHLGYVARVGLMFLF
jgi:hypothetical protein